MKEAIYEKFGLHLKRFLTERFKNYQLAADLLGVHKTYLSQVVNGHRPPSEKLKTKLIKEGFDKQLFVTLEGLEEINKDLLDYEEMKFLYLELKHLLAEKNTIINILEERITKLKNKGY